MTRIYLIRHAEAEGNLYRRGQGQYDALVTDRGLRQIQALAERFREVPVDAVYSSDLYRTRKTASAIYLPHGLPLQTDRGLREVDLGAWENLPWGEIGYRDREQLYFFNTNDPRWQVERSEPLPALRERLVTTLEKLARRHDGETIAVVSHGMALRNLLTGLLGLPVEEGGRVTHSDNTGVSLVEYEEGRWRVVFQSDNSHLGEGLSTLAGQKWWKAADGFWADANLRYEPLDPGEEGEFFLTCRREAWQTVHGDLGDFRGDFFLREGLRQRQACSQALWKALLGDEPVGLLQLDTEKGREEGIGHLSFLYLLPKFRRQGLGIQLIGQAVSVYRPLGRTRLGLSCAPENVPAQRFYAKYGFHKTGETAGSRGPLDCLEKNIGLDTL